MMHDESTPLGRLRYWALFVFALEAWLHMVQPNLFAAQVDPDRVIAEIKAAQTVPERQRLILNLAEANFEGTPSTPRRHLLDFLLELYRGDPDAGVHSAIDWVLRHDRQGTRKRNSYWGAADELEKIDQALANSRDPNRNWHGTSVGHTFTVFRGPISFTMGSPPTEVGRTPDEVLQRVTIPRSFAISSKEVTVKQFKRFLAENPDVKERHRYDDSARMAQVMSRFSPDQECPQIAVTWYEAALYCNWLSKAEGLPESEWVYPVGMDFVKDGMQLPSNYLKRKGYRLPTEAEWEFAARAGSPLARFFGDSGETLEQYAWYSKNPPKRKGDPSHPADPNRTWPVGQLKPNAFGLFDVYGNVWEWCQDRRIEFSTDIQNRVDSEDSVLVVKDQEARTRRGGSFPYPADVMRSAHRGATGYFPNQRRDNVGFRVARTVESAVTAP